MFVAKLSSCRTIFIVSPHRTSQLEHSIVGRKHPYNKGTQTHTTKGNNFITILHKEIRKKYMYT
jgi:hypothetical protein